MPTLCCANLRFAHLCLESLVCVFTVCVLRGMDTYFSKKCTRILEHSQRFQNTDLRYEISSLCFMACVFWITKFPLLMYHYSRRRHQCSVNSLPMHSKAKRNEIWQLPRGSHSSRQVGMTRTVKPGRESKMHSKRRSHRHSGTDACKHASSRTPVGVVGPMPSLDAN